MYMYGLNNFQRKRILKIEYARKLFHKEFDRMHRKNQYKFACHLKFVGAESGWNINKDEKWDGDTLAYTNASFLIAEDADAKDPKTPVKKVESVIYVHDNTPQKIVDACKCNDRKIRFCVRYIIRHEFGHVMHFSLLKGETLKMISRCIEGYSKEVSELESILKTNGHFTKLENWIEFNECARVESAANYYADITIKELTRFFNIIV